MLLVLGVRLATARQRHRKPAPIKAPPPAQSFALGAGLTIGGLWGALPYFAAIDQMLRADLPETETILALLYYNVIFVLPLGSLVVARVFFGARGDGFCQGVSRFFDHWGHRVGIMLLLALGAILTIDGIGWFLGHPVLPV